MSCRRRGRDRDGEPTDRLAILLQISHLTGPWGPEEWGICVRNRRGFLKALGISRRHLRTPVTGRNRHEKLVRAEKEVFMDFLRVQFEGISDRQGESV